MPLEKSQLDAVARLTLQAARAIMERRGASVITKADGSPVTAADLAADDILRKGLGTLLPQWGLVSEEAAPQGTEHDFILIDPLDGTSEFIAGRDEFCISLGGISRGKPVWGVLCAPAKQMLWLGGAFGAERWQWNAAFAPISAQPIQVRKPAAPLIAMVSRTHGDPREAELLSRMDNMTPVACGSALKFAALAEGRADFYPCLRQLHQWDIAGGHALVAAAGGIMHRTDGAPLHYGQHELGFRAEPFMAGGSRAVMDQAALLITSAVSGRDMGLPKK